jgi:hypothetical protein
MLPERRVKLNVSNIDKRLAWLRMTRYAVTQSFLITTACHW